MITEFSKYKELKVGDYVVFQKIKTGEIIIGGIIRQPDFSKNYFVVDFEEFLKIPGYVRVDMANVSDSEYNDKFTFNDYFTSTYTSVTKEQIIYYTDDINQFYNTQYYKDYKLKRNTDKYNL